MQVPDIRTVELTPQSLSHSTVAVHDLANTWRRTATAVKNFVYAFVMLHANWEKKHLLSTSGRRVGYLDGQPLNLCVRTVVLR